MKKQVLLGLALTTFSVGSIVATSQTVTAFDLKLPNFAPNVQIASQTVRVVIPKDLLEAGLSKVLNVNEQQLKDTEFNRIILKNTNASMRGDQLQVSGVIQYQHRERIACVFGKCKHTPWVSVSGRITQNFGVQIKNNKTVVAVKGDPKIEGLEARWYAEVVSLAGKFVGPELTPRVQAAMSSVNGIDVRRFALDSSSAALASKLGLNKNQVRSILNKHVGGINANISSGGNLVIDYTVPSAQLAALKK